MPENAARRLTLTREKIEESDNIDDRDRELLLTFDDRLALQQYSVQRREKLLRHCKILAGEVTRQGPDTLPDVLLADVLTDREAAEDIVRWINHTYENEETNRDYRVALRVFAKHVTDGDGIPESVEWVPSSTSRSYKPTPDPAEMLDWEDDVLPMIDATLNARDAALIAVAWDSRSVTSPTTTTGCRSRSTASKANAPSP
ncbi:MAG: hypothetical protein ABEH65_02795 [Halobacteriales archaeon]